MVISSHFVGSYGTRNGEKKSRANSVVPRHRTSPFTAHQNSDWEIITHNIINQNSAFMVGKEGRKVESERRRNERKIGGRVKEWVKVLEYDLGRDEERGVMNPLFLFTIPFFMCPLYKVLSSSYTTLHIVHRGQLRECQPCVLSARE